MFPSGRARLATRPCLTGSLTAAKTTGSVWVACWAARAPGAEPTTSTSTLQVRPLYAVRPEQAGKDTMPEGPWARLDEQRDADPAFLVAGLLSGDLRCELLSLLRAGRGRDAGCP